jgi:hypothetical protein
MSGPGAGSRPLAEEADPRASDRERDEAVTGLQVAFAEGRLDAPVMAAVTGGETFGHGGPATQAFLNVNGPATTPRRACFGGGCRASFASAGVWFR